MASMPTHPPTDEELVSYLLGEAPQPLRRDIELSLAQSKASQARLAEIRSLMDVLRSALADSPQADAMDRARRMFDPARLPAPATARSDVRTVLAELVRDTRSLETMPGFRGEIAAYQLVFASEAGEIHVLIAPDEVEAGCMRVRGQFDGPAAGTLGRLTFARVDAPEDIRTTHADEEGYFSIALPPGTYDLTFKIDGTTIRVTGIEVG